MKTGMYMSSKKRVVYVDATPVVPIVGELYETERGMAVVIGEDILLFEDARLHNRLMLSWTTKKGETGMATCRIPFDEHSVLYPARRVS